MRKKSFVLAAALCCALLAAQFTLTRAGSFGSINDDIAYRHQLNVANDPSKSADSVDPAFAYDSGSGELIFNVYDTLVFYNGEHIDQFIPRLATSWSEVSTSETSPEALHWYYRYFFQIRTGVTFQPPYNYPLTPQDVEYSFERAMVLYPIGGSEWMFYQPLLNVNEPEDLGDLSNPADVARVGNMIDHAIESNSTYVWFNLASPTPYAPFLSILCQYWSSILSKQWIDNIVIGQQQRPDWSGDWSLSHAGWGLDHTEWIDHHRPSSNPMDMRWSLGPLTYPSQIMYGTGPYMLAAWGYCCYQLNRNPNYWDGWPANFPNINGVTPQGYVDTVVVSWGYSWGIGVDASAPPKEPPEAPDLFTPSGPGAKLFDVGRAQLFYDGAVDIVDPPHPYSLISDALVNDSGTRSFFSGAPLYDGMRGWSYQLSMSLDALFFTFNINTNVKYPYPGQQYCSPGTFDQNAIPPDFFGNSVWGANVRKAFAYALDYDSFIQEAYAGQAYKPPTAIVCGLPSFNYSQRGYSLDIAAATQQFQAVPSLWNTGFSLELVAPDNDPISLDVYNRLASNINGINSKFRCTVTTIPGNQLLENCIYSNMPLFMNSFLPDFPDEHDYCLAFYASNSPYAFTTWQQYHDTAMDALVQQAISLPAGSQRQSVYQQIQSLATQECPSVPLAQPCAVHLERDWLVSWYYNPMYPGVYAYNLWKWYYAPQGLYGPSSFPLPYSIGRLGPADVNYDGKVDTKDTALVAKAFGAGYGPPMGSRWNFIVDTNHDGKIDMKDVGWVAHYFGKTSAAWNETDP